MIPFPKSNHSDLECLFEDKVVVFADSIRFGVVKVEVEEWEKLYCVGDIVL